MFVSSHVAARGTSKASCSKPAEMERGTGNMSVYIDRGDPAIKYRKNELARSKGFVNLESDADRIPVYVYTGFQYRVAEKYMRPEDPRVAGFMPALAAAVGAVTVPGYGQQAYNQAIVTSYACGADNIGWHSDKMRTIRERTLITDVSFGATRSFYVCVPTWEERMNKKKKMVPTEVERIEMRSGDAVILSTEANARTQHAVLKEKERVGARQSVVFRTIKRVVSRAMLEKRVNQCKYKK